MDGESCVSGEFNRLKLHYNWNISDYASYDNGLWLCPDDKPASYPPNVAFELEKIESKSPWFRKRSEVILHTLHRHGTPSVLWEIGAGNGSVSQHLMDAGISVVVIEPGFHAANNCVKRKLMDVVCGTLDQLLLPDGVLSAVGLFDVLEHIPEPEFLLQEIHRCLRPSGKFVLTVPASPALWSEQDECAGHFRRYTKRSLIKSVRAAGFVPIEVQYFFSLLWLPLWIARALPFRLGKRKTEEVLLKELIDNLKTCSKIGTLFWNCEDKLEEISRKYSIYLPFGSSLIGFFCKNGSPGSSVLFK
jgi:SAM-dependent methyltransferase